MSERHVPAHRSVFPESRLRGWVGVFVLATSLSLAACGDRAGDGGANDSLAVVAPEAQSDTANAFGGRSGAAEENRVRVYLDDYAIEMPDTLPAGLTRFEILSRSQHEQHSFVIEGPGVEEALEARIEGNEIQQLRVDLTPGTYRVYCPVEDHAGRGMERQLIVTESDLTAGASPAAGRM